MSTTTTRLSAAQPAKTGTSAVAPRLVMAAFLLYVVLAGGNAVAIRFSNRELAPLWGAGLRFGLAAVVLAAVLVAMRLELPRGRALVGAMLYGALTFGGAFALAYYALLDLQAGFGQVQLALVPLATLLLAAVWRQERLRAVRVVGAGVALVGVVVMSGTALHGPVPFLPLLAALGAVLCFAQGAVLVRRFPPVHPVTANVVGMATATAILLAGSALAGEAWVLPSVNSTWAALAYLVVIGSGVVFVLYVYVLRHWTASRTAYGFVLIPFVTVTLSARLDAEPVGSGLVVGGTLVLAGVYLGALRGRGRP
jgi:drug/metabolite transporter (DMT)-like permease